MSTVTRPARPGVVGGQTGGLSWGEALRLSRLGGREESLRRGLVVVCSMLASIPVYLGAGLPVARGFWEHGYALTFMNDPVNWPGILLALTLMTLPAVHLAALATRVGGPARDRRLASLRSAGATSSDVRRVMRAEALVWSVPGSVLGAGVGALLWWLGARVITLPVATDPSDLESPQRVWQVPLLPGAWPQPQYVLLGVLVVPLLAALVTPIAVRRVQVGIQGQRAADRRVRGWLPATLLAGAAACALGIWALTELPTMSDRVSRLVTVLVCVGPLLLLAALTTFAPVLARWIGRWAVRDGGPIRLLAGRSMIAHPMLAARASASLVLVGLTGGLLASGGGLMESELTRMARDSEAGAIQVGDVYTTEGLFYLAPFWVAQGIAVLAAALGLLGIVIAVAEHVITRRSAIARMVAGGIPRASMARSMVLEAGLPAAVMGPTALVAGLAVPAGWMVIAGSTELISMSWRYVAGLALLLAVAPFAAAWVGSRLVARADDVRSLRDR